MGTFTYDIRSGGRGFSPKAHKNTDGVHDSDSDSQNFADITYVSLSYLLLNDTRIKVNQVKASSGETALLLASKLNHTEIVK